MKSDCRACGHSFASLSSFDKHRTGDFEKPIYRQKEDGTPVNDIVGYTKDTRRCMTVPEMLAAGMKQNERGWWTLGLDFNFYGKETDQDEQEEETA